PCRRTRTLVPSYYLSISSSLASTLSLHDALPIFGRHRFELLHIPARRDEQTARAAAIAARLDLRFELGNRRKFFGLILALRGGLDRKSTRLNSSHVSSSYALFCLKTKSRG